LWASSPINAVGQQRVQDPETHDGETTGTGQGGAALQDGTGNGQGTTGSTRQGIEDAKQSLTRVSERVNNPEIGEQIRTMTESHEQIQNKVMTALSNMQSRSGLMKFIFGPSYQNAGEIKAQATQLRANAGELAGLKEELTLLADQEEVQGAIDSLEEEAGALESELSHELEGFSLFGWLNRILSGY
jgi:uncharacterized protein Yka (UPF0111/DUF47 family)